MIPRASLSMTVPPASLELCSSAGGYCPIGSSSQQPCPAGTYNNFSGAADEADCSSCPPGFYCSGTSNPAPTGSCLSGYYCTGGASSNTQYQVEDGYYSDAGASQQYPCLPGTYQPEASPRSRYRVSGTSSTAYLFLISYLLPAHLPFQIAFALVA